MIKKNIENSPVNLEPDFTNDLTIMQKNWNDYGLVIITQTHGIKQVNGFTVVDNRDALYNASHIINVYYKDGKIINNGSLEDDENLIKYVIHKDAIQSKLKFSNTIYLGNYCWSYNFVPKNSSNMYTVIGNTSEANYNHNPIISNTITSNLFSGLTLIDAYKTKPSNWLFFWNTLKISNESKKRYFSISTDEIPEIGKNGQPIISGKINGYENLKKDSLTYLLFVHEGDDDFCPELAKEDECMIISVPEYTNKSDFVINDDGSFTFEYPGLLKQKTEYQLFFAIYYKNNYYYGDKKLILPKEEEENISNEELVDLGLSVKWASCNIGATSPNQMGTRIGTDFFSDASMTHPELFNSDFSKADFCKSDYDLAYQKSSGKMRMPTYDELKELKEKCTWELTVYESVPGVKVVGPNNNSIFLPTIYMKEEIAGVGELYTIYGTLYTSGTYDKLLGWSPMAINVAGAFSPQYPMSSSLGVSFLNGFEAYIRPVECK